MGGPGAYFAGMKNAGGLCGHDGGIAARAGRMSSPRFSDFPWGRNPKAGSDREDRPAYSMESESNAVPADASAPKKKRPRR